MPRLVSAKRATRKEVPIRGLTDLHLLLRSSGCRLSDHTNQQERICTRTRIVDLPLDPGPVQFDVSQTVAACLPPLSTTMDPDQPSSNICSIGRSQPGE